MARIKNRHRLGEAAPIMGGLLDSSPIIGGLPPAREIVIEEYSDHNERLGLSKRGYHERLGLAKRDYQ